MLKFTLWYLFIGVVFNLIIDISTAYANRCGIKAPTESHWDWSLRIWSAIIWPIGLIFFLKGYFSYKNKK